MLVSLRFIHWNLIPNVIGITFWEVIKSWGHHNHEWN
jgi:hypothetical protein